MSNKIVWSDKREKLGIKVDVKIEYVSGRFFFEGAYDGFGCKGSYRREISGNMDWSGQIGDCKGAVSGWIRIREWRFDNRILSCELTLWGAYGQGPWLPPGGEFFKVFGSIKDFASAEERQVYFNEQFARDLLAHGHVTEADPTPVHTPASLPAARR